MAVFDIEPAQNPEAAALMKFYKQGFPEDSGIVFTSEGGINTSGPLEVNDVTAETLTVNGFTSLQAAQTAGNFSVFGAFLDIGTLGGGLRLRQGANATIGVATMVAGVATVMTNKIAANSMVFLTSQNDSGTPGAFRISARTPGTSFTITCTQNGNTSQVAWWIINPLP